MISHKYKFVFILLPKTGTTSIQSLLTQTVLEQPKQGADRHYDKITENVKDYYMISISRNPFSRVVSLWKFWDEHLHLRRNRPAMEFTYFVKNFAKIQEKICRVFNKQEKIHFYSCVDGIAMSTDNRLSHTDIDFWIKIENFQQDFNKICDKIGIPRQQLPHINKSNHKHYTEYYDDETREIVAEKYKKDIEYFGYEFGE